MGFHVESKGKQRSDKPCSPQQTRLRPLNVSMSDTAQARDGTPQERSSKHGTSLIESVQSACFKPYLGIRQAYIASDYRTANATQHLSAR